MHAAADDAPPLALQAAASLQAEMQIKHHFQAQADHRETNALTSEVQTLLRLNSPLNG